MKRAKETRMAKVRKYMYICLLQMNERNFKIWQKMGMRTIFQMKLIIIHTTVSCAMRTKFLDEQPQPLLSTTGLPAGCYDTVKVESVCVYPKSFASHEQFLVANKFRCGEMRLLRQFSTSDYFLAKRMFFFQIFVHGSSSKLKDRGKNRENSVNGTAWVPPTCQLHFQYIIDNKTNYVVFMWWNLHLPFFETSWQEIKHWPNKKYVNSRYGLFR